MPGNEISVRSSILGLLSLVLLVLVPLRGVAPTASSIWAQGTFLAFGGNLYQLPYPGPFQDGLQIRRFDRASQHSLVRPGAYDVGQTLSITIEDTEYLIIIAELALLLYKDDLENAMLVYTSAWLYPENYLPRRLLKSAVLDEAFFVLSDEHLIERFQIDTNEDQLYVSSPAISELTTTISTVTQTLSGDDVLVLAFQSNNLQFYSLLRQVYTTSVSLAKYCDHVTALYNLPPVAGNGNISFIMNCDRDGLHLQYYVVVSYLTSDPLEVHQLDNVGVPVATSTHLAIRSGNRVTIYDRRHMSDGVPLSHSVTSQVQRIVGFEADNSSFFLIFETNKNLTQIDADVFFTRRAQAIRTLPDTQQGSCDSICLPYRIVNGGILVTVVGVVGYDIVTLTLSTDSSTLTEVARVRGIPEPPAFVEFLADPSNPTMEPTTTHEQPITSETTPKELSQTATMAITPPETTTSMSAPETSESLFPLIIVGIVVVACVIIVGVFLVVILSVKYKRKASRKEEEIVCPTSAQDRSSPAPTFGNCYSLPIPETGDVENKADNIDGTWTAAVQVETDFGYISETQTPQTTRLTIKDRHTESRQSTSSMGTMSTNTVNSSTGGEAVCIEDTSV